MSILLMEGLPMALAPDVNNRTKLPICTSSRAIEFRVCMVMILALLVSLARGDGGCFGSLEMSF